MLGKLIKHELKATSREFSLLYIALVALTVLNKIFLVLNDKTNLFDSYSAMGKIMNTLHTIILLTYVFLCMAVFIMTTVLVLMRFYKNLTGEEGYLMFTLPVPTWMLVVSKLIAAVLWQIASFLVFGISMLVLFWGYGFWEEFTELMDELKYMCSSAVWMQIVLAVLVIFLLMIATLMYNTAEYYFCIAIGHLAKKHRIAAAIGTYFLYNFAAQFIVSVVGISNTDFIESVADKLIKLEGEEFLYVFFSYLNLYGGIVILISVVITAILCYITTLIFKKRLNLE